MEKPRIAILYGSQTGNAQDVAERLGREAKQMLLSPAVMPMDAYDVAQLPTERLLLCVASTTGQGDPPDNMKWFWRFLLRKSLQPGSLANVQFSVFGLGDSNYPKYNVTAKKLFRRLESLGAKPLVPLGLGNDQHPAGYEAALDPWVLEMWPLARQAAGPLPPGVALPTLDATSLVQLGDPKFRVALLPPNSSISTPSAASEWEEAVLMAAAFKRVAAVASGCPPTDTKEADGGSQGPQGPGNMLYGPWRPYFAHMLRNQRITASSHFQDTRHIELDLGDSGIVYEPGDVAAVIPRTPPAAVTALLKRLNLDGSQRIRVEPAESNPAVEQAAARGQPAVAEGTIRALVQGALDVAGASPRRYFFQVLQNFAHTELEQERLAYFATAEGRDDLYRYNQKEGRTVLEVLMDFKTATPPLEWFLEACPPLMPRLFSISSSLKQHPRQLHMTVAVVEYTTPYKRRKRGLCSSYLAASTPLCQPNPILLNGVGGDSNSQGLAQPGHTQQHSQALQEQQQQQHFDQQQEQRSWNSQLSATAADSSATNGSSGQQQLGSDSSRQLAFLGHQPRVHAQEPGSIKPADAEAPGLGDSSGHRTHHHTLAEAARAAPVAVNGGVSDGSGDANVQAGKTGLTNGLGPEGATSVARTAEQQDSSSVGAAGARAEVVKPHGIVEQQNSSSVSATGTAAEAFKPQGGDVGRPVEQVAMWVERGSLRMPPPHVPLLLIGPGTGVAPFRSMLEERQALLLASQAPPSHPEASASLPAPAVAANGASAPPAPSSLFFGCRSQHADFYYAHQWHQLQEERVLLPPPHGLVTAFSRDQASKVYVTHKLREHAAHVWHMIHGSGASVFISGSAQQMPANVVSALEDVAQEQGGMSKEEASKYIRQLELTGRYCVEAWS